MSWACPVTRWTRKEANAKIGRRAAREETAVESPAKPADGARPGVRPGAAMVETAAPELSYWENSCPWRAPACEIAPACTRTVDAPLRRRGDVVDRFISRLTPVPGFGPTRYTVPITSAMPFAASLHP